MENMENLSLERKERDVIRKRINRVLAKHGQKLHLARNGHPWGWCYISRLDDDAILEKDVDIHALAKTLGVLARGVGAGMTLILLLSLASVAWGQQPDKCLVVSGKKNTRVDTIGQIKYRSHYSDKDLRKLNDSGVHIVSLPSVKKGVMPDTRALCGIVARENVLMGLNPPVAPIAAVAPNAAPKCFEYLTHRDGSTECTLWGNPRDPQKQ